MTVVLGWGGGFAAYAQQGRAVSPEWDFPEARQFDFWIGEWSVNNRFFQDERGWVDGGSARVKIFPVLDGKAILEFWDGRFSNGFVLRGFSLRYYDTKTERWQLVLNWPGPDRPGFGELSGVFRHGRGEFFGSYTNADSVEVLQRYTFSDVSPTSLRWDDGTSTDGGRTWRANWIMEFSRTAEQPTWTDPGEPFHTYETGERCTAEEATRFDVLDGAWEGTVSYQRGPRWVVSPARMKGYRVLDGCAVFNRTEYFIGSETVKLFQIRSYISDRAAWVELQLDNQPETGYAYQAGAVGGDGLIDEDHPFELTGFVPSWYKGASPERLYKTTWRVLRADVLRYDVSVSTDGGATWTLTYKVDLQRK